MSRSPTYTRSMSISHEMGFAPVSEPRAGVSAAETLAEMPNLGDDLAQSWQRVRISRSRSPDGKTGNTCQVLDWDLSAGQIVRHIERSLGTSLVINSNLIVGDMRPAGNIRISPVTLPPPDAYFCVGPSVLITPTSHLFAPPLPTSSESDEAAAASAYDRAVEAATAASLSAPTTANPFTDSSVALITPSASDDSAVSGAIKAAATLYMRHSSADPDDLELQWLHIKSESDAGVQGSDDGGDEETIAIAAALAAAKSCSNSDWLPLKLGDMAHDSMITAPLPGFGLFRCVQRIKSAYEPANLVRIRANGSLDIVRANGGEEHRVAPHLVESEQQKQAGAGAGASGGTKKPPPPRSKRDSMTFETPGKKKNLRPAAQFSASSSDKVDTLAPLPSLPASGSSDSNSSDRKSRRRPSAQVSANSATSAIGKKRRRTAPTVYRRLLRAVGLGKSVAPGDPIGVRRFVRENVQFCVFLHGVDRTQLGTGAQGAGVGSRRGSRIGSRGSRRRSTSVSRSRSGSMMSDVLQDTADVPAQLAGSIVTLRVWACANRPDQQWLMRVRQRTMEMLEAAPDPGQESGSAPQIAQCPRDFAEVARGTFLAHAGETITMQVDAAPLSLQELHADDAASLTGARALEAAADAAAQSVGNESPRHLPQSKTVDVEQLRWDGTPTFVDFDVRLPNRDTIALSADSSDDAPIAPTFTLWLLSKFAEPNKLSAVELSLMDADDIAMAQEAGADEGPTHRVRVDLPIPLLPRESTGQLGGRNLQVTTEFDEKALSASQVGTIVSPVAEGADEEEEEEED